MRKTLITLVNLIAILACASVAFAAEGADVPLATGLIKMAAALGMAIAAAGLWYRSGPGPECRLRRHRSQSRSWW